MFQCYGIGQALIPVLPPPLPFESAPTSNQTNYEIGQIVYTPPRNATDFYIYAGGGIWIHLSDSDGPIESVLGTANQITVTTAAGVATVSLPAAITTPGTLTSTGLLTASAALTVTTGDLTVTNGNVLINGNGKYLQVQGGAETDFIGTATLTAGITASIANTNITAADRVFVERTSINGSTSLGVFIVNVTPSTGFTIEALKPADATRETNDASIVSYFIVRQV